MPRKRSVEPRYRRRVVLELTPDESTVLDALADRHGTIRGAVLAGLRELEADRSAALDGQARDLSKRLERAEQSGQVDRDQAAADIAALGEKLAASQKALKLAQGQTKMVGADLREARTMISKETAALRRQSAYFVRELSS